MPLIKSVRGFTPQIGSACYLADDADVIGEVIIGDESSVWFKTVLRGDVNRITIGSQCNIQDMVMIHGTYEKSATWLGNRVSIGHSAVIHGCTIHDHVLVGMGAIIMDNVEIESDVYIAAGAVLTPGMKLESGFLYGGVPARKLRELDDKLLEVIHKTPDNYIKYKGWYS